MDAAGQLGGEDFVDPALAGNAALPGEGGRYHLDAEMGLAAFAVAGMALVFFRIINDLKTLRRKCLGQLVLHSLCYGRSEARRGGQECVRTCRFRGSPYN